LELQFPSDPRLLHIVRSVVGQTAGLCGFDEDEIQFIILAVDEACANVIRHAYEGRSDGQIMLSCSARDNRVEFRLSDQGKSAGVNQMRPRALEDIRPGGLGLHLIRSIMDEVNYGPGRHGNELFLAKSLRPRPRVETGAATE
jgi:anti-sigma regulatory factor (Ser/Thr protein kinase)